MKKKMQTVKDYIQSKLPGEGGFTSRGQHWNMSTLVDATKGLDTFDFDIMSMDLDLNVWGGGQIAFNDYLYHMLRIEQADMKHPIILSPCGFVIDGWHRIAKAIMAGESTIKAVRLFVMPEPDREVKTE